MIITQKFVPRTLFKVHVNWFHVPNGTESRLFGAFRGSGVLLIRLTMQTGVCSCRTASPPCSMEISGEQTNMKKKFPTQAAPAWVQERHEF